MRLLELLRRNPRHIVPIAHDALSARLIENAGYEIYAIGGFSMVGARFALPDVGLASAGEMFAGVRDIMSGARLPVIVDADDGYGDVKNVARTVMAYERLGAAAVVLEDQVNPKRCGHLAGKDVVSAETAVQKICAAVRARSSDGVTLIARTDALAIHGLDEAIRRASMFAEAGADIVFVEAPRSRAEIETVARRLAGGVPLLINMPGNGRTPFIAPEELWQMGYSLVLFPAFVLIEAMTAMSRALAAVRRGDYGPASAGPPVAELAALFGIGDWIELEQAAQAAAQEVQGRMCSRDLQAR